MKQKLTKTIEVAIIIGLCLGTVSGVSIVAGGNYSFTSEEFEYYTVAGNSSNMTGMTVEWENGNITISFDLLYKSDSFEMIFFNKEKEIIYEYLDCDDDCDDNDCDDCDDCDDDCEEEECELEREYIEVDKYVDKIVYKEREGNETISLAADKSDDSFFKWARLIIVGVIMFLGGMGVVLIINKKPKDEEEYLEVLKEDDS